VLREELYDLFSTPRLIETKKTRFGVAFGKCRRTKEKHEDFGRES
jgi:hypothetical protein